MRINIQSYGCMGECEKIHVELLEEAKAFVAGLPKPVRTKVYGNVTKVEMELASTKIFKKLSGTDL